jgi:hypothetical protein
MSRIYIAASLKDRHIARTVSRAYQQDGDIITLPWWDIEEPKDRFGKQTLAEQMREAVASCDTFHFVIGRGRGSHVELGMAIAYEKHIVWDDPHKIDPCLFYYLLENYGAIREASKHYRVPT